MTTVRQLERLWTAGNFLKLKQELLAARQESQFGIEGLDRPCALAALAIIRLDELCQSHHPLYAKLLRVLLGARDRDGGWEDPAITALCVRALMLGHGDGAAVTAGLNYLASLQKEDGLWPAGPIRRMQEDPIVSLFILYQLGDDARFRSAVRFGKALQWFELHASSLNACCRSLHERTSLRWIVSAQTREAQTLISMS